MTILRMRFEHLTIYQKPFPLPMVSHIGPVHAEAKASAQFNAQERFRGSLSAGVTSHRERNIRLITFGQNVEAKMSLTTNPLQGLSWLTWQIDFQSHGHPCLRLMKEILISPLSHHGYLSGLYPSQAVLVYTSQTATVSREF